MNQARAAAFAAHSVARDAEGPAARAVARAAGHAVVTAPVPGHARHSARATDESGATPAYKVTSARATAAERDWQYRRLPGHLRQVAFPAGHTD
ncbi:hypothetical protein OG953_30655 [Streptomyces sp. NBC_00057]